MASTTRVLKPEEAARVDRGRFDSEKINRPTITFWQGAWRRLKKNPIAVSAMILLGVLAVFILLGPLVSGENYLDINLVLKNAKPNGANWFGTDAMGRDLFCRVWIGARLSLLVALVCSFIQIAVGCAYGGAMAYFGGVVDNIMMRILEIVNSFPSLLVTLLIMMVVGKNVGGLLIAMCITSWCGTARQMRGQLMQLRESEYVQAAQMIGASPVRIITKHLHSDSEPVLQHPHLHLHRGQPQLPGHGPVQRRHQPGRAHQRGEGEALLLPLAAVLPGGGAVSGGAGLQPSG